MIKKDTSYYILSKKNRLENLFSSENRLMLTGGRTLDWIGEINDEMFSEVKAGLIEFLRNDAKTPVELYIMSPGGDSPLAFAFYDLVNSVLRPKPPLIIIASGMVASAALIVLLSVPRKNRYITPHACLFLHQARMLLPQAEYPSSEIHGMAKGIHWHDERYVKKIVERTHLSEKRVWEMMSQEATLSPEQAKKYGFVGHIFEAA